MSHKNLVSVARALPAAWRSTVLDIAAGAQVKVLRMDESTYPDETHEFDEALIVLEGQMNLEIHGDVIAVKAGEMYVVPAQTPHAVAAGSHGTLVIIDR